MFQKKIFTPLGSMRCVFDNSCLYYLQFEDCLNEMRFEKLFPNSRFSFDEHPLHKRIQVQLDEYFVGKRQLFEIPLCLKGTAFQQTVWQALQKIDYGTMISYDQLGKMIQRPSSMRAIGNANGANNIAIIIPCHRVIRSDGTIGGYAGGKARKEYLLKLERKNHGATDSR